jgi:hypothetical protein
MHSAIEHEPVTTKLDIICIRADLGLAGEVNELQ